MESKKREMIDQWLAECLEVYPADSRNFFTEKKNRFANPVGTALNRGVEAFIDGPELTIEGLCLGGRHHVLAISEKAHYAQHPCVAWRLAYPPRLPSALLERIASVVNRAVEALGLRDGLTHAECRLRGDEPFLIEIAARGWRRV